MQHGAGTGRKGHVRACLDLVSSTRVISIPIMTNGGVGT